MVYSVKDWNRNENRGIRPTDQIMMDSFKSLCDWLEDEADSELYSLSKIYYKIE